VPILRLLSYNVRSLRDDSDAVVRIIKAAQPNVVAIQEAPRFFRWRTAAARLARRSGLVVVTGGRTAAANLLLSGLEIEVEQTHDVLFSKDRRLHQRGTAIGVLSLRGHRFALAGIHLDVVEGPRLRHVGELHAAVDAYVPPEVPLIVAGDTNDDPGSRVWQALTKRGADSYLAAGVGDGVTSSVGDPQRRLDAVFVDERLTVVRSEVINTSDVQIASDHRPVLVEIELGD
jgi:endonuclease/exonuclease/phosphatase family metal-dependent hydrolase